MFQERLASEFAPFASLSAQQLEQLERHYDLLRHWNQRLNLTRIGSEEEAIRLHYCESLFLGWWLPAGSLKIIDVGSGGGFPGIPVAIIRPECEVTLVESHQRKSVFLREASRELSNVRVVPNRAEEIQGEWDWLVSRAVSPQEICNLSLAPNVALLLGENDAVELEGQTKKLPWGAHRVLFHVERRGQLLDNVPRGT